MATRTCGDANKVIDARVGLSKTKAGKYSLSIGDNAITIPGLPTNPTVAGGLPSTSISNFTAFGRQSTNPQWQNPSLLDPKVNFTWVKGKHSLKFGYEYEHIWMAVNDNNPLYGSFSYSGGYSLCPSTTVGGVKVPVNPSCTSINAAVADNYWADFLFGTTNNYSLANLFVAHLRQTMDSTYAQDDWKILPKLTLNLGLRWEYGSPYSEQHNLLSNFDPISQTVLTITPGYHGHQQRDSCFRRRSLWQDLGQSGLCGLWSAAGLCLCGDSADCGPWRLRYQLRALHACRLGRYPGHQCSQRAVRLRNPAKTRSCRLSHRGPRLSLKAWPPPSTLRPTTSLTFPRTPETAMSQDFFLSVENQLAKNSVLDIAFVGNHGVKLQGFLNANQINPAAGFTRPYGAWPSDITAGVNEFWSQYQALQVRYEQRSVAGLTLLNSFTWSHSLDNASASLEGNTPSPQDGNNIAADYAQSDYNLPISDILSLVYDLPVGRGKQFLGQSNALVNAVVGGWQLSGINTMQAGTPFNLTYTPNSANAVSPQIAATYRGANEYRPNRVPGVPLTERVKLSSGYIQYVNYAALTLPATKSAGGTLLSPFGNESRNPGRTPAYYTTDFALNKNFDTPLEGLKVQFRTEMYNAFNHTNLYLPASGLGGTLGGAPSSGGSITSTFEPRIIQFGLKVIY